MVTALRPRSNQLLQARLYGKYRHLTDNDEQLAKYILQAWYNSRRKLQSRGSGQQLTTIINNCERERVVNHTAKQIVRATREKKNNKEKRTKKENKKRKALPCHAYK